MTQDDDFEGEETSQLSAKELKFLASLMKTTSFSAACRAVGISRRTGYRMLDNPRVRQAYDQALSRVLDVALGQMFNLLEPAIDVVRDALTGVEPPNGVRVRTAWFVVHETLQIKGTRDMSARLDALETRLAGEEIYWPNGRKPPKLIQRNFTPDTSN